jgi:hypothetical protein
MRRVQGPLVYDMLGMLFVGSVCLLFLFQTATGPSPQPPNSIGDQSGNRGHTGGNTGQSSGGGTTVPGVGGTTVPGVGGTTVPPGYRTDNLMPFGSDAEFTLLLVALAVFMISVQLMMLTEQIHMWYFAGDKNAPPSDAGWLAFLITTFLLIAACFLREWARTGVNNPLLAVMTYPKDFALGLFVSSLLPSSVSMAKAIGLFGTANFATNKESHGKELAFTLGTALIAFVNLVASIITIALVAMPAVRSLSSQPVR